MTEPAPSSAQMVRTPSTTQLESSSSSPSEPPGYFDIIPDSHVFFPPKDDPQSRLKPASTAKAKEKTKGIYSDDPILDQNPNELWRFLVSNLQKPHLAVHLSGTHTEFRTRTVSTGAGTSSSTHTETYTETVTDFSFGIDVSKYVIPQWTQIIAHPSRKARKAGQGTVAMMPTVRETLKEYTSSKNRFKEFRLKKFVVWDYERVTQLLTDLVRSTGYRTHVGVAFPMQDYKVVALDSNEFSRAAHSKLVRVLCVVSCLCIVFWPAWAIARKRMKDRLDCEYQMAVSADEFYAKNCARIHSAVVQRLRRSKEFMDSL